jgi:hypothetical protein
MDQDTFDIMWEMSKPGGEAEGCFLRVPQTDYFKVALEYLNPARGLPDVGLPLLPYTMQVHSVDI